MVFAVRPLVRVPVVRGGGGIRLVEMAATDGPVHVMSRAPLAHDPIL